MDYLTVLVVSDKAVFENKNRFPINQQNKRAENLKKLAYVDDVLTPSDFAESCKIILSINPEVFVFGYDQNKEFTDKMIGYLKLNNVHTNICFAGEFANGVHTSHLINHH